MIDEVRATLTAAGFTAAVPEHLTQARNGLLAVPFPGDLRPGFSLQPFGTGGDLPGIMVGWWGPNKHTATAGWLAKYRAALHHAGWGVSPLLHYVGDTPLPYSEPVPGENPPWLFVWRSQRTDRTL